MATLFSHGATHLLCGRGRPDPGRPLLRAQPPVEESTAGLLHRWYDFLVEHVELLAGPGTTDVTTAMVGDYNGDCEVAYQGATVSDQPTLLMVWRRVVQLDGCLVVHLINLTGQDDTEWDAPRKPPVVVAHGVLRVRRVGPGVPRIRVAVPDQQPDLIDLEARPYGDHVTAALPPLSVWQMLVIDPRTDFAFQLEQVCCLHAR